MLELPENERNKIVTFLRNMIIPAFMGREISNIADFLSDLKAAENRKEEGKQP